MALMVIHHLWNQNGLERYEEFGVDTFVVGVKVGILCKICVGIYMFMTGYGLMSTFENGKFKMVHSEYWPYHVLDSMVGRTPILHTRNNKKHSVFGLLYP